MVIEIEAYQWGWAVHYPDADVTVRDRIVIPVDRDVRFVLSSRDVIHSIDVPALGIKQDILPGTETVARTRATETASRGDRGAERGRHRDGRPNACHRDG
jgi:cytochrome c oxidase subunit 2